ncbi:uncharacterized protein LOC114786841 [Denticeps clupeoides]|uniref:uncharacterized protein LOC114786841 n=1 Tax=Denticeps clupeoides TaxID=299321 RepID=UPI0010A3F043|nr:uncharacterized protein LOC114786841 [Denticeps clupeoides]
MKPQNATFFCACALLACALPRSGAGSSAERLVRSGRSYGRNGEHAAESGDVHGHTRTRTAVEPQVECRDELMIVTFKPWDVGHVQVFAPDGLPLPLSELPSFCNIFVRTMKDEVVVGSRYDGCFVKTQRSGYVLPFRWYGVPVRASCPFAIVPLKIVCRPQSMDLTVFGAGAAGRYSVQLNGERIPLLFTAALCWYNTASSPGMESFSIPYSSCGLTRRNNHVVLTVRVGEEVTTLSCPAKDPASQFHRLRSPWPGLGSIKNPPVLAADRYVRRYSETPPSAQYPHQPSVAESHRDEDAIMPAQGPYDLITPFLFYHQPLIHGR